MRIPGIGPSAGGAGKDGSPEARKRLRAPVVAPLLASRAAAYPLNWIVLLGLRVFSSQSVRRFGSFGHL